MKELQDSDKNLTSSKRNPTDSCVKSRNFRTTIPSTTCLNGQLQGSRNNEGDLGGASPLQVGEEPFRSSPAQNYPHARGIYYSTVRLNVVQPPKSETTGIVPLQPQEEEAINGWQLLAMQVQRINQLAAELEAAIFELKAIVSRLNSQRGNQIHSKGKPFQSVCQYFAVSVPDVKQKSGKSFILTMRKVDLFRAEREAALLAKTLRQKFPSLIGRSSRKNSIGCVVRNFLGGMLISKF